VGGAKRRITVEDLFRLRVINHAAISPDGARVAVSVARCDWKKNKNFASLYLVDARGGRLRRLTTGDHVDTKPTWSPDGLTLAFLSDRDKCSAIWLLPMDGGEPVRLTERDCDVKDFAFSPDGRRLCYAAQAKNEKEKLRRDEKRKELARRADYEHVTRLLHKLDGQGFWNGHYTHIHVISVRGGKDKQITSGDHDDAKPHFSPDGKRIAFLSNRLPDPDRFCENADIFTVSAHGGTVRQITKRHGPILNYSWSPDGKRFAFVGHMGKTGEFFQRNVHVWIIPATGGAARDLTSDIDNNCFNVTLGDVPALTFAADPPIWSADGERIYFIVSERGACNLYETATKPGPSQPRWVGEHVIIGMSQTKDARRAALIVGTATDPNEVYTLDLDKADAAPRRITRINRAHLNKLAITPPEPIACKRGRHTVHGWLVKPPGFSPKRKYPLILQIHGGPHTQYGHAFFHEMHWLAAAGYVVLYTNPRGSVGYGLKFVQALHHRWGIPDTPDLLACVDRVVRRGFTDSKRLYITGGSYGGFMTNWIIGRDHRFRAAVTQRSVHNMESMLGSDYGWFLTLEMGMAPWEDARKIREASPCAKVKNIKTPLLIIHSRDDLRCPIGQAEELFCTMKYLGRKVEMVQFNSESHGLSRGGRPQNRAERLRRILDWFERHK
jgi:dipeptidyl aminopeptidase/acylaminoacyl peptidase